MNNGNQESIFIHVSIDADPVMLEESRMTIIAKDGFALTRNRKMHFISVKICQDKSSRSFRNKLLEI